MYIVECKWLLASSDEASDKSCVEFSFSVDALGNWLVTNCCFVAEVSTYFVGMAVIEAATFLANAHIVNAIESMPLAAAVTGPLHAMDGPIYEPRTLIVLP